MTKRKVGFWAALIVTLVVIILLITGSPLLTYGLDSSDTIPLGTFITWAGMISLPLTVLLGISEFRSPANPIVKLLKRALLFFLILGILWVPLSYLLAGNISFNFSEKATFQGGQAAMRWFWRLSYGIPIGALSVLCLYWINKLFDAYQRRNIKTS